MVLAIDAGCAHLRVAQIHGATFLTYGSGTGQAAPNTHADAGIALVDRDRILEDPALTRGLPNDMNPVFPWPHPLGHAKGDPELVGTWPDAAFLALGQWENTGQGLGPDFYRWTGERWEERPSEAPAILLDLLRGADGSQIAAFWRNAGNSDITFVLLDRARWFARTDIPALSLNALCGGPWPAMARLGNDIVVVCREGDAARVAHFANTTKRWTFRTFHGSSPFALSSYFDAVAVTGNGAAIAVLKGATWTEGAALPTLGLPASPSRVMATTAGVEWAIAAGRLWSRPRDGAWLEVSTPSDSRPVSIEEGGAGDIWVETTDGHWLRDRPLDGVYSCNTERRPGSVFDRRLLGSGAHGPSATGPDDWVRLYVGIAAMHGISVTDAEVRAAITDAAAFEKLARRIDAPDIERAYESLYLADVDNDGAKEYVLTYRNPTGEHNDMIVGVFRPLAGGALQQVSVPIIGPSKVQLMFHADPFLSVDAEGVTMRFDEWVGPGARRPEDRRLARYLWKGTTVRLLDRVRVNHAAR